MSHPAPMTDADAQLLAALYTRYGFCTLIETLGRALKARLLQVKGTNRHACTALLASQVNACARLARGQE